MITFHHASELDMLEVSKIHKECFPDSITAIFSNKLRAKYCSEFLHDGYIILIAKKETKIIGFCMGYLSNNQTYQRFIRNNFFSYLFTLVFRMFCANSLLLRILVKKIKFIFTPKEQGGGNRKNKNCPIIEYIAVTPDYRGTGVSQKLLYYYESILKERGIFEYGLSTRIMNHRAKHFYESLGFHKVYQSRDLIAYHKQL